MTLAPAAAVLVTSGALEGKSGVVRAIDGDEVEVALQRSGRETAVWLQPARGEDSRALVKGHDKD